MSDQQPPVRVVSDTIMPGWVRRPDLDTDTVDAWELRTGHLYAAPKGSPGGPPIPNIADLLAGQFFGKSQP